MGQQGAHSADCIRENPSSKNASGMHGCLSANRVQGPGLPWVMYWKDVIQDQMKATPHPDQIRLLDA
jgi:hypothetical protein